MTPWIATLHVRPLPGMDGGLGGSAGAYAKVLALAHDEVHYREVTGAEMEALGLFIAAVEDAFPYMPDLTDSEDVRESYARLSPAWPVQYHTFHSYPSDESSASANGSLTD